MAFVCRTSFEHCIYVYVLTMGVFTTSWWVVNQPIVMFILVYAFTYCCLLCILSWWDATLWFMPLLLSFMITYGCFMILPGDVPVLRVVWVWHPRDYVRGAYKRIDHAEISNF